MLDIHFTLVVQEVQKAFWGTGSVSSVSPPPARTCVQVTCDNTSVNIGPNTYLTMVAALQFHLRIYIEEN